MKIIDKIQAAIEENRTFFSFEYFPPKTKEGLYNLYNRIERMATLEPEFVDVTWGAGGTTSEQSLEISSCVQKYYGLEVMMHLTCTNMPRQKLADALKALKDAGVSNILALRGDAPAGEKNWKKCRDGFSYAIDLVKYIRDLHGDHFGICVAGYPEGHIEANDKKADLYYLKDKIEAGADFVITQLFYDENEYIRFIDQCREIGITCPILPGMMPIQNYRSFKKMTDFCETKVPPYVLESLNPIRNDDAAVKKYGIDLCVQMCQRLINAGAPGIHFYTLNLERSVTNIIEDLGLVSPEENRRVLPWRPSTLPSRSQEDVRPIFWMNRPKSYIARTMDWDDFPNGRWGDSRSPAFGELKDYHLIHHGVETRAKKENRAEMWGENPTRIEDIGQTFVGFCKGSVKRLPWCDGPTQNETENIMEELLKLNRRGFLTINSQPQVNGAPSTDPKVGWGDPGGYVYQKAYVEFFVSPENLKHLLSLMDDFPSLTYHAVNSQNKFYSNTNEDYVNAVTWGVFPGKEIVQPTVVDFSSFMIWKDEAFQLWLDEWAPIYPEGSPSRKLIQSIHDTFYLMNIVENDYIKGDVFSIFEEIALPQKKSS